MRVKLLTAMHNNKIIAFEFFCVIQNKQDLGECYQPSVSTKITPTSILQSGNHESLIICGQAERHIRLSCPVR